MGDSQRVAYLQRFQAGGFDLVQIPSYKVTSFERWSRNANWWFYRELYRYWVPVANTYVCGGMHVFWQRNGVDNDMGEPTTVDIAQTAENVVTITVTADDPTFCGVADVTLNYTQTILSDFRLRGGVRSYLHVSSDTETAV